jgi:DNA polymerase-3 subunit alpha
MLYFSNVKQRTTTSVLFDIEPAEYSLPQLQRGELDDAFDELELLGFPLCDPFKLIETQNYGDTGASDLPASVGRPVTIVGYVVTTKDTRTMKGESMHFGTFYDRKGQVFDTVHFPEVARHFPFRGRGFYNIRGKVVEDFGICMIEVTSMEKLPMISKRAEEFLRDYPQYGKQPATDRNSVSL